MLRLYILGFVYDLPLLAFKILYFIYFLEKFLVGTVSIGKKES